MGRVGMLGVGTVCAVCLCFVAGGDVVPDLQTVRGIEHYQGPDSGEELLRKNGFAVLPRFYHRIFGPYLHSLLPPFITADSVHRTYHVVFEEALEQCETKAREKMAGVAGEMLAAVRAAPDAEGKALALDYFRVADCLIHGRSAPEGANTVAQELVLIQSASGVAASPLFGYLVDYSQFKPRGFYTKSPELQSYFRALSWFGNAAFRLKSDRESQAAMLIAGHFARRVDARVVWSNLNAFYTGLLFECDDLTVEEYARLRAGMAEAPGDLAAFRKAAWQLRDPKYNDMPLPPGADWIRETKGMRFMGKRYPPDGGVFAAVTDPKVPERYFPTVLDVLAANGSARARKHLESAGAREDYITALKKARTALTTEKADYGDSAYVQTLEVIEALTAPPISEAAAFAKTDAYADKNLMTAAAVWASTRHAWILHAKHNMNARGMEPENPIPGYIEPNPAFFAHMARLNATTLGMLRDLDEGLAQPFEYFAIFLETLTKILKDQINGSVPTPEARQFFDGYGRALIGLQGHHTNIAPRDIAFDWMALVADVHTEWVSGQCLEAAIGGAMPIYAVVEVDGVKQLLLGGVYSYYEFLQPISERLTDEAWREQWETGRIPLAPPWTASFMAGGADIEAVLARLKKGEAVPEAKYIDDPRLDDFLREAIHREDALESLGRGYHVDPILDIASKKIPNKLKPLLIQHLRTMPVPGYDGRLARASKPATEHAGATSLKNAMGIAMDMGRLVGPCLTAEDLDVLWEIYESDEANRQTFVLQMTESTKEKTAEQFWLQALENAEDSLARTWANKYIVFRASKDVTPHLFERVRTPVGEINESVVFLLTAVWGPPQDSPVGFGGRFDTHASLETVEGWRMELREILQAYLSEKTSEERAILYSAGTSWQLTDVVQLSAELGVEGLPEVVRQLVTGCHWEPYDLVWRMRKLPAEQAIPILLALLDVADGRTKLDAMRALGRTQSRHAIAALRPYLEDTASHLNGMLVCDQACRALDRILGDSVALDEHFYYGWEDRKNRKVLDKHRLHLLEITAQYAEEPESQAQNAP